MNNAMVGCLSSMHQTLSSSLSIHCSERKEKKKYINLKTELPVTAHKCVLYFPIKRHRLTEWIHPNAASKKQTSTSRINITSV